MRLARVSLQAAADCFEELPGFYGATLKLAGEVGDSAASFRIGSSELRFTVAAAEQAPFYHFALLVPGDRFEAARAWAAERVELLAIGESPETVIHFQNWNADSCYFHDPGQNIVELIAHAGFAASGAGGPFNPQELLGLSEIGLIGDASAIRTDLEAVGLEVSQAFGPLTFMVEPTATLILAEPGYGWLPRGRAAEPWPVEVALDQLPGIPPRTLSVGRHRVTIA